MSLGQKCPTRPAGDLCIHSPDPRKRPTRWESGREGGGCIVSHAEGMAVLAKASVSPAHLQWSRSALTCSPPPTLQPRPVASQLQVEKGGGSRAGIDPLTAGPRPPGTS